MRAEQALAWRVHRHLLDGDGAELLAATAQIGGLHAQLMSSAELSAWVRGDGSVPRALEDRTLVKTWAMRGTLHLLPAAEYGLWQAALSTYDHYLKGSWFKAFGITRAELEDLIAGVGEALDGDPLTREELALAVMEQTGHEQLGEKLRESWGGFLKPAAFRGVLCFADNVGQKVRFTRPDRWLGAAPAPVDPEEALLEVTRRYLGAYGPASREDYARWWAVSPARALERIQALGDEAVEHEGRWMLAEHASAAAEIAPSDTVRLLPAFDPYVAGAPRADETLLAPAARARVYRPQGWLTPVLLVGGRIAGVWRSERKGARVEIEIEPFAPLKARVRRAAEAEAERLAEFLGATLHLSFTG